MENKSGINPEQMIQSRFSLSNSQKNKRQNTGAVNDFSFKAQKKKKGKETAESWISVCTPCRVWFVHKEKRYQSVHRGLETFQWFSKEQTLGRGNQKFPYAVGEPGHGEDWSANRESYSFTHSTGASMCEGYHFQFG